MTKFVKFEFSIYGKYGMVFSATRVAQDASLESDDETRSWENFTPLLSCNPEYATDADM